MGSDIEIDQTKLIKCYIRETTPIKRPAHFAKRYFSNISKSMRSSILKLRVLSYLHSL